MVIKIKILIGAHMKNSLKIFLLVGLVQIVSISSVHAKDIDMDLVIKENLEKALTVAETVKDDKNDININITVNVGTGEAGSVSQVEKFVPKKEAKKAIEFKPVAKSKVKQSGFYVAPKFNYVYGQHAFMDAATGNELVRFQDSMGYGVATGFKFDFIRIEAEYSKAREETSTTSHSTSPWAVKDTELIFANLYFDFNKKGSRWTTYIGGGVGAGTITLDWNHGSKSSPDMFVWNAGAGIVVNIVPSIALDLNCRYVRFEEVPTSLSADGNIANIQTLLGLRFTF